MTDPAFQVVLIVAALALEWLIGYPAWAVRVLGHPVIWIGALIARLDRAWNRDTMPEPVRRLNGAAALLVVLGAAIAPAWLLQCLAMRLPLAPALAVTAVCTATLLAQRSLHAHVRRVADALDGGGLIAGRAAVSHIVGRNPDVLDEAGVARAAIESLAENFSDGAVAPALWCAIAGVPGIAGYKAANTADSMIGHHTPRHRAFGWAAARFDDVVNLPAARLAALLLIAAALVHPGTGGRAAWRAVWRDAGKHRSPNAGWPEAAMAGALGLRLAGPRVYGAEVVEDAWMGDGTPMADSAHIRIALSLYRTACGLQIGGYALLVWLILPG